MAESNSYVPASSSTAAENPPTAAANPPTADEGPPTADEHSPTAASSSAPASPSARCTICDEAETQRCSRCKSIYYCSSGCQKADWKIHRIVCKILSEFDNSTRPSENHVRGILFPEDDANGPRPPQVIWLECMWTDGPDGDYQVPIIPDPIIGDCARDMNIESIPIRDLIEYKVLPNRLNLRADDFSFCKWMNLNSTLCNLSKPGMYRGPVLAFAAKELDFIGPLKDIDAADFHYLADFLKAYAATNPFFPHASMN